MVNILSTGNDSEFSVNTMSCSRVSNAITGKALRCMRLETSTDLAISCQAEIDSLRVHGMAQLHNEAIKVGSIHADSITATTIPYIKIFEYSGQIPLNITLPQSASPISLKVSAPSSTLTFQGNYYLDNIQVSQDTCLVNHGILSVELTGDMYLSTFRNYGTILVKGSGHTIFIGQYTDAPNASLVYEEGNIVVYDGLIEKSKSKISGKLHAQSIHLESGNLEIANAALHGVVTITAGLLYLSGTIVSQDPWMIEASEVRLEGLPATKGLIKCDVLKVQSSHMTSPDSVIIVKELLNFPYHPIAIRLHALVGQGSANHLSLAESRLDQLICPNISSVSLVQSTTVINDLIVPQATIKVNSGLILTKALQCSQLYIQGSFSSDVSSTVIAEYKLAVENGGKIWAPETIFMTSHVDNLGCISAKALNTEQIGNFSDASITSLHGFRATKVEQWFMRGFLDIGFLDLPECTIFRPLYLFSSIIQLPNGRFEPAPRGLIRFGPDYRNPKSFANCAEYIVPTEGCSDYSMALALLHGVTVRRTNLTILEL